MSISYHYQTDVVRLIKNYMRQHPHCEDTIDGITQWWVQQQKFADSMVAVETAMKILAAQGDVSSVKRDDKTYYRLTKRH